MHFSSVADTCDALTLSSIPCAKKKKSTAPDPLIWDHGGRTKTRRTDIRVNVDLASLPGPPGFLNSSWIQVHGVCISGTDVAAWPYSVSILIRFTSFLNTLHWPSGYGDLCHFGISFLELSILFEQWAGHRLLSERVTRPYVRANRPHVHSLCACVTGN